MIEQSAQMYGGTCISIACIPTKTLLHDASLPSGTSTSYAERYEAAIHRKNDVTGLLRSKNFKNLDDARNVTVYTGNARFLGALQVEITAGEESVVIAGEKFFINTGAKPRIPDIDGIEASRYVFTSTSIMDLTELPKRLVIIGDGTVGLEFATMYQQFGAEVTVLSTHTRLLEREDQDVAAAVHHELTELGTQFIFDARVNRIEDLAASARISLEKKAGLSRIEAEAVLVATGREPVTENLGLENIGAECNDRGFINVDAHLRTSVENVWALGDINGGPQFTYISLDDYRIVKDQRLGLAFDPRRIEKPCQPPSSSIHR